MSEPNQDGDVKGRSREIAHSMYDAYGDSAEWKNFAGNPMPTWEELPQNIRDHWNAAALRAIDLLYNPQ